MTVANTNPLPPSLSIAKGAYSASERVKLLLCEAGTIFDTPSTATAPSGICCGGEVWNLNDQVVRAMKVGQIDSVVGRTVNIALGTMPLIRGEGILANTVPLAEYKTQELNRLQGENRELESRVSVLEHELNEFRPHIRTIQRLLGEYSAATEKVRHIIENLRSGYRSSGALEKARILDGDLGPIDPDR